jgi:Zn-dependent protease with chaperone function
MTREHYEALVRRLEQDHARDPERYRWGIRLFSMLGALYFGLVMALSLAMIVLAVVFVVLAAMAGRGVGGAIQLAMLLVAAFLPVVWVMLRALWLRNDPPDGLELQEKDCPKLFSLVGELRDRLATRSIDRVVLTDELNAAMRQDSLFGPFGRGKNFLILGLPLMQMLDPDEFRAVVAHEFGHHSGNHGVFGARYYRIRTIWLRFHALYLEKMEEMNAEGKVARFLVLPFLRWFVSNLDARAFVLSRGNEYEADRCAADFAGHAAAVRGLARLRIVGRDYSDARRRHLQAALREQGRPPADTLAVVATALRTAAPSEGHLRELRAAFLVDTGYSDTHPSLADRAAALGFDLRGGGDEAGRLVEQFRAVLAGAPRGEHPLDAVLPLPVERTAAEEYLGPRAKDLADVLGQIDSIRLASVWTEARSSFQATVERRDELLAAIEAGTIDHDGRVELGDLLQRLGHEDRAGEQFSSVLAENPDHPGANLGLGEVLLQKEDLAGLEHLERAIRQDIHFTPGAASAAIGFLRRAARKDETNVWLERLDAYETRMQAASEEREAVLPGQAYAPSRLNPAVLDHIRRVGAGHPRVRRVLVARRLYTHFPEEEYTVVVVDIRPTPLEMGSTNKAAVHARQLLASLDLNLNMMVVVPWGEMAPWKKLFKRLPAAIIHQA